MTAYWYRETLNFGDLLTPVVLRNHGFTPTHAYPPRAQLASTGSILEHLPETFGGVILGSGFIDAQSHRRFPRASILALRGSHTRERIEGHGPHIPLGDPGLYAARLLGARHDPCCALGIIPHHSNLDAPAFRAIAKRAPGDVRIISPVAQPADVFARLRECEMIVSASLHGLILADALGIPSVWSATSSLLGGEFKFHDYATAVGRRIDWAPAELTGDESFADLRALASCAPADEVEACQQGLAKAFDRFAMQARAH
ncbi:polysaccharide pyruvyl transferase family protein [Mameliella alba]|uniref:polysaccharide pyruvyl transferase family protein n=1 Tax=Mameliella alba TaxID=561184 RepID=UPI0013FE0BC0|nr:polysaccharide pyruvyl transferase family protein [Mameliella alba]